MHGIYLLYNFYILKWDISVLYWTAFIQKLHLPKVDERLFYLPRNLSGLWDATWSYPYKDFSTTTELCLQDWLLWCCYIVPVLFAHNVAAEKEQLQVVTLGETLSSWQHLGCGHCKDIHHCMNSGLLQCCASLRCWYLLRYYRFELPKYWIC